MTTQTAPRVPAQAADLPLAVETVAEAYLALLRARGIERLYLNAGTDFAPIAEAYGRLQTGAAAPFPEPVPAAHENLAIGMAHGAYLMTGRPQAVMFHVSIGTANAVCGVMNAARDRIPLLVTAGRSPLFEAGPLGARDARIHWAQEMFDQAGMLRELVKWDYELRDGRQVEAVVDRALTLAAAEPRGPVYLTLPREVLAESADAAIGSRRALAVPSGPRADARAVERLAERLAAAAMPVIVAAASGADPDTVAPLARLCERYAIGFAEEHARYLNLPADHPHHLGYQLAPVFADADALCFLECDVPWMQRWAGPRADAFVAQCGIDPIFARYPVRGHRADLSITATAASLIADLDAALEARAGGIDPARRERLAERSAKVRRDLDAARRAEAAKSGPISRDFVAAALAEVLGPDAVVFNEYWLPPAPLGRTQPRSYFFLPAAGGLGWGLSAALGAKQVAPERTVVACVGDGAYLFANPAACHHASARYGLPVLTVVFNNSRWGAVDYATNSVFPKGHWRSGRGPSLSDLAPMPALERYAEASGGHGERVSKRDELLPALRRAVHAVEVEGRQALINVLGE
ncbi:MAG: thiamine pyrophosphate-requiring protein [Deltaproteobacteria bacterium]|nr:thiamine pyrophosphate-requiring protein [Deltaproteobacteria bacterium]